MLKKILRAAALAAAVLASVPGMAAEQAPQARVYYGDLDLSNQADIQTLDRRLSRAVKAVCPSDNGVRELSMKRIITLCRAAKHAEIAPVRQSVLAAAARNASTTFATAQ
jgi:UrcA family protein